MIQVEHYGIHWGGPTAWLVQGRSSSNFIGLASKCPFEVSGGECNHLVATTAPVPDRSHWLRFMELMQDPLVQAMLPLPRPAGEKSFFVSDKGDTLSLYLACLSRLSSPIKPTVKPLWLLEKKDVDKNLNRSNIQPWVITQAQSKEQARVTQILQAAEYYPRTVIFTGSEDLVIPKKTARITTGITDIPIRELVTLPLESIGAAVLRKYARKEPLS